MSKKKNVKDKNNRVECLVIGDPHFKHTNLDEMNEFSKKSIEIARAYKPSFIVILGDTLDRHELLHVLAKNAAEEWIDELTKISEVYLIIGNHDMANPKEFLTKDHAFSSLKKWKSAYDGKLHVIDYPLYKEIKDKSFVFCPYVPNGRFKDALDEVCKHGNTWDLVDCIFSHQEFKGGHQGSYEITDGDEWEEEYPPVINGHFHNEEIINKNIFIPGTPIQHSFGDTPDKKIWFVTFEENEIDNDEYDPGFKVKKIDLGMKTKKTIILNIENVHEFKISSTKKHFIKLKLKGRPEQIDVFKITELYKKLCSTPFLKVEFISNELLFDDENTICEILNDDAVNINTCRDQVLYLGILQKVVNTKSDPVKEVYKEIVGEVQEEVVYDIVFESDESYSKKEDSENISDEENEFISDEEDQISEDEIESCGSEEIEYESDEDSIVDGSDEGEGELSSE